MSTSAAQILGQSGSAGRGSPSGAEGVDEGEGDAWQPGGQELHAVLGNTGAGEAYTRKSGYIRESHQPGRGGGGRRGPQRHERDSSALVYVSSRLKPANFYVKWYSGGANGTIRKTQRPQRAL